MPQYLESLSRDLLSKVNIMSIFRLCSMLAVSVGGIAAMVWLLATNEPQPKATVNDLYHAAASQMGVEKIFQGFRR